MPEITLEASVDSIPAAMDFLRKHIDAAHAELIPHVELAVEELMINVVQYAYENQQEGQERHEKFGALTIGCRWVNMDGQDQFCVWLRDWGKPFDPFRDVPVPDTSLSVDERAIGGLGVHLVKHISNHYVYSDDEGSNVVEVYFRGTETP